MGKFREKSYELWPLTLFEFGINIMKISVAICTYNGENFIEEQLTSIINQSRRPDEIIIGDDGSSDLTIQKAKGVLNKSDIFYKIIINEVNLGPFANFQNVISHCSGDIIFTCDQDDVWLKNKVECIESYFVNHPNTVLVFSDGYVTDQYLNITGNLWESVHFSTKKQVKMQEGKYYEVLLARNCVTGAATAFRSSFSQKAFPMPLLTRQYLHDYWLALMAPFYGDIGLIEQPLIYYRQHENNVIGVKSQKLTSKIKRWILASKNNLSTSEKYYFLSRDICIFAQNMISKNHLDTLNEWQRFCDWRYSLTETSKLKASLSILGHMLRKQYKKYYAYKYPGLQDIISCFLKNYDKIAISEKNIKKCDD